MHSALLSNIVVLQRASILHLLALEDEAKEQGGRGIPGIPLLLFHHLADHLHRVLWLHLQHVGAHWGLDEDLHLDTVVVVVVVVVAWRNKTV